jgi:hypothetical protein
MSDAHEHQLPTITIRMDVVTTARNKEPAAARNRKLRHSAGIHCVYNMPLRRKAHLGRGFDTKRYAFPLFLPDEKEWDLGFGEIAECSTSDFAMYGTAHCSVGTLMGQVMSYLNSEMGYRGKKWHRVSLLCRTRWGDAQLSSYTIVEQRPKASHATIQCRIATSKMEVLLTGGNISYLVQESNLGCDARITITTDIRAIKGGHPTVQPIPGKEYQLVILGTRAECRKQR